MLPYLRLGPFLLQTSGLALLLGVWVGLTLSEKEARRQKLQPDLVYNLVFYGLIAGLIGARLAYAARYLNAYLQNPLSLLALNPNTLSAIDGVLIGILAAFIYGHRKRLALRPALDALAPGLAVFMIFLGTSHLLNGDAYGAPSTLPWSIFLWGEYRHPTQIYEIVAALVVLWVVLRRPFGASGSGLNFLFVIALSAGARLFLEAFRGDSLIWPAGLRAAQVISLIVIILSLWLMRVWAQMQAKSHAQTLVEAPS
jgi:prolipoprotein diacylglyceryl transferase